MEVVLFFCLAILLYLVTPLLVGGLGLFAAGLFGSVFAFFAYFVLRPFGKAAHKVNRLARIHVADYFSLCILLAIPLAIVAANRNGWYGDRPMPSVRAVGSALMGVNSLIWWHGAASLSGIGVRHGGRRFVFLGILIPLAIVGSIFSGWVLLSAFSLPHVPIRVTRIWAIAALICLLAAWCGRRTTHWVLNEQRGKKLADLRSRLRRRVERALAATVVALILGLLVTSISETPYSAARTIVSQKSREIAATWHYPFATICDVLPPLLPAGPPPTSQDLVLHENDWRQIEFIPRVDSEYVARRLTDIRRFRVANESEQGWIRTFVRPDSPKGFAALWLPYSTLADHLRPMTHAELYLCQDRSGPYSPVNGGFAFRIDDHTILYGTQQNGVIEHLGLYLSPDSENTTPLEHTVEVLHSLSTFVKAHIVDWCQGREVALDSKDALRDWLSSARSENATPPSREQVNDPE